MNARISQDLYHKYTKSNNFSIHSVDFYSCPSDVSNDESLNYKKIEKSSQIYMRIIIDAATNTNKIDFVFSDLRVMASLPTI